MTRDAAPASAQSLRHSAQRDENERPSPLDVARAWRARPGFVWLDSPPGLPDARSLLAAEPRALCRGSIFDAADRGKLRAALRTFSANATGDAGLMGWIDYDGHFCFGVYEEWLVFDHRTRSWRDEARAAAALDKAPSSGAGPWPFSMALDFQPQWTRDGFCSAVRRALDYIAAGDIYQVNLAQSWACPWPKRADALAFYERLRAVSPAPHGAFMNLGERHVLSASPELFLRMEGRGIITRPIKGTRPRSAEAQQDAQAAAELRTSPKETAELVMITDLERNDLGQVCEFGSVRVADMLRLEPYPQVYHLVSTVEGTLRPEVDHIEALAACFPGGSITGAPKKRAREIIAELEPAARGLFTGAIGYFGVDGHSQFSIAIRTAVVEAERISFHAGAGIVADSDPVREFEETYHKAEALFATVRNLVREPLPNANLP